MTSRRHCQRGMTLIEVLIAVSLAALLTAGLAGSLGQAMRTLDNSDRRIAQARRNAGAQRLLEQQVAAFMPVIAKCGIAQGRPTDEPFFDGRPNVTRFVTNYSLTGAARGGPRIVEWFVAPAEDGRGVRLLLNELPYTGPHTTGALCAPPMPDQLTGIRVLGFEPPRPREGTFVLADHLQSAQLSYLERELPDRLPRWAGVWTPRNEWPAAIRLETHTLPGEPSTFSPISFTGRIRIDIPPREQIAPR